MKHASVHARRLLLSTGLSAAGVRSVLRPYGFVDVVRADANIQQMAGEPQSRRLLADFLEPLLLHVAETAEPDQALNHWERYLDAGSNRMQLFDYLRRSPRMLHLVCTIFGNSRSLAQTLIRDPLLVYWLIEEAVLSRRPSRASLARALDDMLRHVTAVELKLESLRRFKRREMLRIGVRDLLRLATVSETTQDLSDLATVLIQAAYGIVEDHLRRQYGVPTHQDAHGRPVETRFAVIALGKLGGGELNYSSDVDLIYVYDSDAGSSRDGEGKSIPNEEYFEYVARDLTRALAEATQEGYVFRVDLRLRAEGSMGRLARSVDDYAQYYRARGEDWERLALLKAWPVAGSLTLGRQFIRMVKPFVFGNASDRVDRQRAIALMRDVKRIKDRIDAHMAKRGHQRRNVKLGTGGIREIEFIVQAMQVLCGGTLPGIRERNTARALVRFKQERLLSNRDAAALTEAYWFLRDVEHKLQMVHDLQTHALPETRAELIACAVRLGYTGRTRREALENFRRDYVRHTKQVHQRFRELFASPQRLPVFRAGVRKLTGRRRRIA